MGKVKDLYGKAELLLLSNNPIECNEGSGMINVLDSLTEESYLDRIDWSELRNQKISLLEIGERDIPTKTQLDAINGIIHLIDALQDYAVDELGIPEEDIYIFDDEEMKEDTGMVDENNNPIREGDKI